MNYEFYETPAPFTRWLFQYMAERGQRIHGSLFAPCVGAGAIPLAVEGRHPQPTRWLTNDLDPRWPADTHIDARSHDAWPDVPPIDWTVDNPPFTTALEIIERALTYSRVGVAMHLRASIHEITKTGVRRTWMQAHRPTGILWLPRFGYQRSPSTGKWSTDSVCACWVIWFKDAGHRQFIDYAPEWVIDALKAETKAYRARMDALTGAGGKLVHGPDAGAPVQPGSETKILLP